MGHTARAAHSQHAVRSDGYFRHRPALGALYQTVAEHWPAFLEQAEDKGGLPRFVVREFEQYLRCGILEQGKTVTY